VTDDQKEDWWLLVKGKTIGSRPELIEEIRREAGVEKFHMYTTESFLRYSKQHLDVKVEDDAIDEVKKAHSDGMYSIIFASPNEANFHHKQYVERHRGQIAEDAVYNWLATQGFDRIEQNTRFPDFIVHRDGFINGYEVKTVGQSPKSFGYLVHQIMNAERHLMTSVLDEVNIVLCMFEDQISLRLLDYSEKMSNLRTDGNINIISGNIVSYHHGAVDYKFIPHDKICLKR
jgi:hypothetical protein